MCLSKSLFFILFCLLFVPISHSQNLPSPDEQILVNGRIWRYTYRNIKGNPFLFSNKYLDGSVSMNGRTFGPLKIRYDIFIDEIIMPHDTIVLKMNKEQIDSFTIVWENRKLNFIKIAENSQLPFSGYVQNIYSGESRFLIKYEKKVDQPGLLNVPDNFYQIRQQYFISKGKAYKVRNRREVLKLMQDEETRIKNYIRENKVHLRMSHPESFTPVLRYYDQIIRQE